MDNHCKVLRRLSAILCFGLYQNLGSSVDAFQSAPDTTFRFSLLPRNIPTTLAASRRIIVKDREETGYDPLGLAESYKDEGKIDHARLAGESQKSTCSNPLDTVGFPHPFSLASTALLSVPSKALAKESLSINTDPNSFQPVCPTSDGFYRFLQQGTQALVGPESFQEYGPLIAGGLLRIRLEFCVVESFFNEAVGPFIEKNGLSWVLPLHETVETFLAGTVFALAATFILLGSTKIVTVAITYTDFLLGAPSRLFGGFFYDRALGKPVTLDIGFGQFKTRLVGPPEEEEKAKIDIMEKGPGAILVIGLSGAVKLFGQALRILREISDAIDIFVGRYLVVWATGYVLIKFIHYKIFPNFPF